MLYELLRPAIFALDPETAHELTIAGLSKAGSFAGLGQCKPRGKPVEVMGLKFPNAVGLAAGLDKNGEAIDGFAALGFGFIEIGTVTPKPQPGNPKPRLFRLPQAEGIINRMGFNNHGVDTLIANVRQSKFGKTPGNILGINIGKNATTPIERATDDYLACLDKVYAHASYVTVNISSPNTKNLRDLQGEDALDALLSALKLRQDELAQRHGRYVPIALKIAPDLDEEQIATIAGLLRKHRIDAVIATNTTLARDKVAHLPHGNETGGLSGAPVREQSTAVIRQLSRALQNEVPIVGVGGIFSGTDAREKIAAGASLVQVYTGLIYRGPGLVAECVRALA